MSGSRASVSMKDVAALAGVSVGTVSNVLNSPERVLPGTRKKVERAIDKLGWVRNESARQLRAGRSDVVGMVVMDLANPYFTDLLRGAEQVLYQHGNLVSVGNSDQDPQREDMLLRHFMQSRVSGIILAPIGAYSAAAAMLHQAGIPVVLLDRGVDAGLSSVGVDDVEGGRIAVQHLVDQGHRKILLVGGPLALAQVRDRHRGAELAIAASREDAELKVMEVPSLSFEEGLSVGSYIASLPSADRPTAVFAANDLIAMGLLQSFSTQGVRVPEDIAIIGYDDIEFAAAAAVPLSSVRQPRHRMGQSAAQLLRREIASLNENQPVEYESMRFAPELVARASTAVTIS